MWYNYLNILFQGTSGSISMKLGMKHQRFKLFICCSNDNPVLILAYLQQGKILQFRLLYGKMLQLHFVTLNMVYYINLMIK